MTLIYYDGGEWRLIEVNSDLCDSGLGLIIRHKIMAFSESEIWMHEGGLVQFDGNSSTQFNHESNYFVSGLPSTMFRDFWGTSSDNIYLGYDNGDILHFNGETFTQMNSLIGAGEDCINPYISECSEKRILDIYGTDENHIYALTYETSYSSPPREYYLLFNNGIDNDWEILREYDYTESDGMVFDDEYSGLHTYLWAYKDTIYAARGGGGVWKESISTGEGFYAELYVESESDPHTNPHPRKIVGLNYNDIIHIGAEAHYYHFNGESWNYSSELYNMLVEESGSSHWYNHGGVLGEDLAVICGKTTGGWGESPPGAYIAIGRRNR